jgi:type IV pilus assembly protein PilW
MKSTIYMRFTMKLAPVNNARSQSGFSLIELMIGITISMIILLAATTTLIMTSSTGKTTTDLSQLQQQGATALRIIGSQMRQARALALIQLPPPNNSNVFIDHASYMGFGGLGNSVEGVNGGVTDTLSVSYAELADSRDCLGNWGGLGHVDSSFAVAGTNLECTGSTGVAQVIADGVEDFQVRYGVKVGSNIQYFNTPLTWASVSAVEVCLQLRSATANNPASGNYVNCQGVAVPNDGRLRRVFRNTFLLRNQNL